MEREPVGDEALLEKALSGADHLALREAEFPRDRRVGPEGAAVSIGGEVQKEKKRDLLQGEPMEEVAEAVVHPGEVPGDGPDLGGLDWLTLGDRGAHAGGV